MLITSNNDFEIYEGPQGISIFHKHSNQYLEFPFNIGEIESLSSLLEVYLEENQRMSAKELNFNNWW